MSTSIDDLGADQLLRHAAWLRRLAGCLVSDAARAEDLVQETWVAALRTRPPERGSLRPWLGTVLRNAARKSARDEGARLRREGERPPPPEAPDPAALCAELESERLLTDELSALEEPYRAVLLLRYYRDLRPAEIAKSLGIPPGTVRWRIQRALSLLRERLDRRTAGDRAAWCLLLAPLVRSKAAAGVLAAPSITFGGILTVKTLLTAGAGLALLVLAYVGLSTAGLLPETLSLSRPAGQPVQVAFRPIEREHVEPPETLAPVRSETARASRVAVVGKASPVRSEPISTLCRVDAVLTDRIGNGLPGATLRVLTPGGPAESAPSSGGGEVTLEVDAGEAGRGVLVEACLLGFASHSEVVRLTPAGLVHLGRIALLPGGCVRGRVVDPQGRGIAGAIVAGDASDGRRQELEMRRYTSALEARLQETHAPMARSDSGGAFVLGGLEPGYVRLWARADGSLPSYTVPVEVRALQETYGVEIVLEPIGAANLVRGRVLDPERSPVANARLEYRESSAELGYSIRNERTTDAQGGFEFVLPRDAELTLTARDADGAFVPATASDVEPGTLALELVLGASEQAELLALDQGGEAVEVFGFAVLDAEGSELELQRSEQATHTGGRAQVRLPGRPFLLRVRAPLHEEVTAGPFASVAVGEPLRVVLPALPGLAGRVVGPDGEGVRGTRVSLHALVGRHTRMERDGVRCRQDPHAIDETLTDEGGGFRVTLREPGTYVVRAECNGLAPAESAPLEVGSDLRAGPLELLLGPGGAIEGRVRLPAGADPTGTIVLAHRGDGHPQTERVAADGHFRFERLTPGPWLVESRAEDVLQSYTREGPATDGFEDEVHWNCDVQEGRTTWFDLDLSEPAAYSLEGRLDFHAEPPCPLTAWLCPPGADYLDNLGRWPSSSVDPSGTFRIAVREPGDYRLVIKGLAEARESVLVDTVNLQEPVTSWERDVPVGSLVIEGCGEPDPGEDMPPFVFLWRGPGQMIFLSTVAPDSEGVARIDFAPAGRGALVRPRLDSLDDPTRWSVLKEVRITAGKETRVAAP